MVITTREQPLSEKKIIANFQVDGREFFLFLYEYEIRLEMCQQHVPKNSLSGHAWLNFEDEARIDDVNQNINAFQVMCSVRWHLLRYLQQHQLNYFYFHASTERKARIYPRFAKRLRAELPHYDFCQNEQSFYFYHQG